MEYMMSGQEVRAQYEERLRQAEQNRRAARVAASRPRSQSTLLVRTGEWLVAMGERLKRQGGVTYAYGEQ